MPSKALLLFAEWRAANKAATEAEIAQFDATLVYLRGSGPKPAEKQLQRTNELRAHAAELFRLAMAQFDTEDQTQTAQPRSDPPTRRPADPPTRRARSAHMSQREASSYSRAMCR